MRQISFVLMLFGAGVVPCSAGKVTYPGSARLATERVFSDLSGGSADTFALQLEGELWHIRRVGVGLSFRKEGFHISDGWGVGVHTVYPWRLKSGTIVSEMGIRFFIPPSHYSSFEYRSVGGVTQWQQWSRITIDGPFTSQGMTVVPVFGVHYRRKMHGIPIGGGLRATMARYDVAESRHISGRWYVIRDSSPLRPIVSFTVTIGLSRH